MGTGKELLQLFLCPSTTSRQMLMLHNYAPMHNLLDLASLAVSMVTG